MREVWKKCVCVDKCDGVFCCKHFVVCPGSMFVEELHVVLCFVGVVREGIRSVCVFSIIGCMDRSAMRMEG